MFSATIGQQEVTLSTFSTLAELATPNVLREYVNKIKITIVRQSLMKSSFPLKVKIKSMIDGAYAIHSIFYLFHKTKHKNIDKIDDKRYAVSGVHQNMNLRRDRVE